jgi:hypothetical protein
VAEAVAAAGLVLSRFGRSTDRSLAQQVEFATDVFERGLGRYHFLIDRRLCDQLGPEESTELGSLTSAIEDAMAHAYEPTLEALRLAARHDDTHAS